MAPHKIEDVIAQAPLVFQSYVYGNSLESFPVAIVVPDEEAAKAWGASTGLHGRSYKVRSLWWWSCFFVVELNSKSDHFLLLFTFFRIFAVARSFKQL